MKKLILFPYNGNAREAVTVIAAVNGVAPQWQLLGFVDDNPAHKGRQFAGVTVLGGREVLKQYADALVLAVPGRPENYQQRAAIINSLNLPAQRWASLVHPSAEVGCGATVGVNCLIMQNVVLTAGVTIGNHVVILPNTVIAHDATIADFTLIGSNVTVSGGVTVGENCYIGSGASLIQGLHIGAQALVGMGSVVLHDVEPAMVVAGCPAHKIREQP